MEVFRCIKNSAKIVKQKRDFWDFHYRYALLQKSKIVLTYYEYIFDFLKKCIPISNGNPENLVSVSGFAPKNA